MIARLLLCLALACVAKPALALSPALESVLLTGPCSGPACPWIVNPWGTSAVDSAGSATPLTVTRVGGPTPHGGCIAVFAEIGDNQGASATAQTNTSVALTEETGGGTLAMFFLRDTSGATSVAVTNTGGQIYFVMAFDAEPCNGTVRGSNSVPDAVGTVAASGTFSVAVNDLVAGAATAFDGGTIDPAAGFIAPQSLNSANTLMAAYTTNSGTYRFTMEDTWKIEASAGTDQVSFTVGSDTWSTAGMSIEHQ